MEEAKTRIMDRIGEQQEQIANRMSELEREIFALRERERLRMEINLKKQDVS